MTYEMFFLDMKIVITMPYELSVLEKSRSFMRRMDAHEESPEREKSDFRMELRIVEQLEDQIGYSCEDRVYVSDRDADLVYYKKTPSAPPYACVRYEKGQTGAVTCELLRGHEFRIPNSSFLFDIMGIEQLMLMNGGLLLHCSLVKYHDRGIIFSAPAGTGKSTQAELWARYRKADIINGDRAGLRKREGRWRAYGLPYAGSSRIFKNENVPVAAIFMLRQAPVNQLRKLSVPEAFRMLYPEITIHNWNREYVAAASELLLELIGDLPVYLLECRPDKEAVELVEKEILQVVETWNVELFNQD